MTIRTAGLADTATIVDLFRQSVLVATERDYDQPQREAWAARGADAHRWEERVRTQHFLLVEQGAQIVGFGSIDAKGYLDTLYVHPDHQGLGIATHLLPDLETWATEQQIARIATNASTTARPFFECQGYIVVAEQQNFLGDAMLVNFQMEKML